jgi:hypothetical protein
MMQIMKSSMKLYYKIMVSSIYTAQNNGFMSDVWKFTSNFYISVALAGNMEVKQEKLVKNLNINLGF